MRLRDHKQTRLNPSAVTSFYPDRDVRTMQKVTYPSIQMTIGSCKLEVVYDKEEDRDADLKALDQQVFGPKLD
jgi:hypothetical protein